MAGDPKRLLELFLEWGHSYRSEMSHLASDKEASLTQELLQKEDRKLVPRCFLCNLTRETDSYLFLHCNLLSKPGICFSASLV